MLSDQEQNLRAYYDKKLEYYSPASRESLFAIMKLVRAPTTGHMLDVGCGDGRACEYAHEHDMEYTGVDYSLSRIQLARQNYPRGHNDESRLTAFHHSDVYESLQNTNPGYSLIWCCEVLEHLADPVVVWNQMLRISPFVVCTVPVDMPHKAHLQVWKTAKSLRSDFRLISAIDTVACRTPGGMMRKHFVMTHDRREE